MLIESHKMTEEELRFRAPLPPEIGFQRISELFVTGNPKKIQFIWHTYPYFSCNVEDTRRALLSVDGSLTRLDVKIL